LKALWKPYRELCSSSACVFNLEININCVKQLHKKGCVYISKLGGARRKNLKGKPVLLRTWDPHYLVALLQIFS